MYIEIPSEYMTGKNAKLFKNGPVINAGIWLIDSLNSLNQWPRSAHGTPYGRLPEAGDALH